MAMERQFVITDTHSRTITAVGFHPVRREIAAGFEGICESVCLVALFSGCCIIVSQYCSHIILR